MLIKSFKHKTDKTRLLEIHTDENPQNPRKDGFDNLGIMVCVTDNLAELGDVQVSQDELEEHVKNAVVKLPLYLLDHSGVKMQTTDFGDKWDSSQVGYIYVTQKELDKECKNSEMYSVETITKILVSEVAIYSDYLEGNVHGIIEYKIDTCNLGEEHKKQVDSCWGFYGDPDADSGIFDGYNMDEWEEIKN